MARTKYYHANEVAELLGITLDEVRSMLKNNDLKGHKLGRRWLIDMNQPIFEHISTSKGKEIVKEQICRYVEDSEHEEIFVNIYSRLKNHCILLHAISRMYILTEKILQPF